MTFTQITVISDKGKPSTVPDSDWMMVKNGSFEYYLVNYYILVILNVDESIIIIMYPYDYIRVYFAKFPVLY